MSQLPLIPSAQPTINGGGTRFPQPPSGASSSAHINGSLNHPHPPTYANGISPARSVKGMAHHYAPVTKRTVHAYPSMAQLMATSPVRQNFINEAKRIESTLPQPKQPLFSSITVGNLRKTYLSIPSKPELDKLAASKTNFIPNNGKTSIILSPAKEYENEVKQQWLGNGSNYAQSLTGPDYSSSSSSVAAYYVPPYDPTQMHLTPAIPALVFPHPQEPSAPPQQQQSQSQRNGNSQHDPWAVKRKNRHSHRSGGHKKTNSSLEEYMANASPSLLPRGSLTERGGGAAGGMRPQNVVSPLKNTPLYSNNNQGVMPTTLTAAALVNSQGQQQRELIIKGPIPAAPSASYNTVSSIPPVLLAPLSSSPSLNPTSSPVIASVPLESEFVVHGHGSSSFAGDGKNQQPPTTSSQTPLATIRPVDPNSDAFTLSKARPLEEKTESFDAAPAVVAATQQQQEPIESSDTSSKSTTASLPPPQPAADATTAGFTLPAQSKTHFNEWKRFLTQGVGQVLFSVDPASLDIDPQESYDLVQRILTSLHAGGTQSSAAAAAAAAEAESWALLKRYSERLAEEDADFIHVEDLLEAIEAMHNEQMTFASQLRDYFTANSNEAWGAVLPPLAKASPQGPELATCRQIVDLAGTGASTARLMKQLKEQQKNYATVVQVALALAEIDDDRPEEKDKDDEDDDDDDDDDTEVGETVIAQKKIVLDTPQTVAEAVAAATAASQAADAQRAPGDNSINSNNRSPSVPAELLKKVVGADSQFANMPAPISEDDDDDEGGDDATSAEGKKNDAATTIQKLQRGRAAREAIKQKKQSQQEELAALLAAQETQKAAEEEAAAAKAAAEAQAQQAAAEAKAKAEAEEKARVEAEQKARAEAEHKARAEAEQQARIIEAEQKARLEAEEKARVEAEAKTKADADAATAAATAAAAVKLQQEEQERQASEAERVRQERETAEAAAAAATAAQAEQAAAAAAAAAASEEDAKAKAKQAEQDAAAVKIQSLARGRAARNEVEEKKKIEAQQDALAQFRTALANTAAAALSDAHLQQLYDSCSNTIFLQAYLSALTAPIDASNPEAFKQFLSNTSAAFSEWQRARAQIVALINNTGLLTSPMQESQVDALLAHSGFVMDPLNPNLVFSALTEVCSQLQSRNLQYDSVEGLASVLQVERSALKVSVDDVEKLIGYLSSDNCHLFPDDMEASDPGLEIRMEDAVSLVRAAGSLQAALAALKRLDHAQTHGVIPNKFRRFVDLLQPVKETVGVQEQEAAELQQHFERENALQSLLPSSTANASAAPQSSAASGKLTNEQAKQLLDEGLPLAVIMPLLKQLADSSTASSVPASGAPGDAPPLSPKEIAAASPKRFSSTTELATALKAAYDEREARRRAAKEPLVALLNSPRASEGLFPNSSVAATTKQDPTVEQLLDAAGDGEEQIVIQLLQASLNHGIQYNDVSEIERAIKEGVVGQKAARTGVNATLKDVLPNLLTSGAAPTVMHQLHQLESPRTFESFMHGAGSTMSPLRADMQHAVNVLTAGIGELELKAQYDNKKYESLQEFQSALYAESQTRQVSETEIQQVIQNVTNVDCTLFDEAVRKHHEQQTQQQQQGGEPEEFSLEIKEALVARMVKATNGVDGALFALNKLNRTNTQFQNFDQLVPAIAQIQQEVMKNAHQVQATVAQPAALSQLLPNHNAPLNVEECAYLVRVSDAGEATSTYVQQLLAKGGTFQNLETLGQALLAAHVAAGEDAKRQQEEAVAKAAADKAAEEKAVADKVAAEAAAAAVATAAAEKAAADQAAAEKAAAEKAAAEKAAAEKAAAEKAAAERAAAKAEADRQAAEQQAKAEADAKAKAEQEAAAAAAHQSSFESPSKSNGASGIVADLLLKTLNDRQNCHVLPASAPLVTGEEIEKLIQASTSSTLFPEAKLPSILHQLNYTHTQLADFNAVQNAFANAAKDAQFFLNNPMKCAHVFKTYNPVDYNEMKHLVCSERNEDELEGLRVHNEQGTPQLGGVRSPNSSNGNSAATSPVPNSDPAPPLLGSVGLELSVHLAALASHNEALSKAFLETPKSLPIHQQSQPNLFEVGDYVGLRRALLRSVETKNEISKWMEDSKESGWLGQMIQKAYKGEGNPKGVTGLTGIVNEFYAKCGCFTYAPALLKRMVITHDNVDQPRPSNIAGVISAMQVLMANQAVAVETAKAPSPATLAKSMDSVSLQQALESQLNSNVLPGMSEEEADEARSQYISLELAADKLDRAALGVLAWSHPFLRILRSRSNIWEKVAESDVVRNSSSPTFHPIMINLYRLNHNEPQREIKIQALAWDPDGSPPQLFGELVTNLAQLLSSAQVSDGATSATGTVTGSSGVNNRNRRGGISLSLADKRLTFKRKDGKDTVDSGFLIVRKSCMWLNTTVAVLSSTQPHYRLFPYPTECLAQLSFFCRKLEKQSSIGSGKADPFVLIYCARRDAGNNPMLNALASSTPASATASLTAGGGQSTEFSRKWNLVFQSEVVSHSLNPIFLPGLIKVEDVCGGDMDRDFLVRVCTNRTTKMVDGVEIVDGDLIGEFETNLKSLCKYFHNSRIKSSDEKPLKKFHLVNPKRKLVDKNYKHSGDMYFAEAKVFTVLTRSGELEQLRKQGMLENTAESTSHSKRATMKESIRDTAARRKDRSSLGYSSMVGLTDTAADLQRSSLLAKAAAVARLNGENVEQPSQSQMVDQLVRQRTMGTSSGKSSRRGSMMAGSATDRLIASMMGRNSGSSQFPPGSIDAASASPVPAAESRKTSRASSPINEDDSSSKPAASRRVSIGNLPTNGGSQSNLLEAQASTKKNAKLLSDRRSCYQITLAFKGLDLRKISEGMFGSTDSYLQIFRWKDSDEQWSELGTTSVVNNSLKPAWDSITVRLPKLRTDPPLATDPDELHQQLYGGHGEDLHTSISGGTDYKLLIKVWHYRKKEEAEFIGGFETTLTELQNRATRGGVLAIGSDPLASISGSMGRQVEQAAFQLHDPNYQAECARKGKEYKYAGLVLMSNFEVSIKDKDKRKSKRRTAADKELSTIIQSTMRKY